MSRCTVYGLLACLGLTLHGMSGAHGLDLGGVRVVKSTTTPGLGKPAELTYTSEGGETSSLANVAIVAPDIHLGGVPGLVDFSALAAIGLSRNSLSSKRSDRRDAVAALVGRWTFDQASQTRVVSSLNLGWDDDRKAGARGQTLNIEGTLYANALTIDPGLGQGRTGFAAKLRPSIGLYRHRVSRTDDPGSMPVGHYGGGYARLDLSAGILSSTAQVPVLSRLGLSASAQWVRDSSVSTAYRKASYRYLEASAHLPLGEQSGKGWKPSLTLTRSVGNDRLGGEGDVARTKLSLTVSYGI